MIGKELIFNNVAFILAWLSYNKDQYNSDGQIYVISTYVSVQLVKALVNVWDFVPS